MASLDTRRPRGHGTARACWPTPGRGGDPARSSPASRRRHRPARHDGGQARRLRRPDPRHRRAATLEQRDDERGGRDRPPSPTRTKPCWLPTASPARTPCARPSASTSACRSPASSSPASTATVAAARRSPCAPSPACRSSSSVPGEKLDGLDVFDARRVAGRILGQGDVVALVERAAKWAIRAPRKLPYGRIGFAPAALCGCVCRLFEPLAPGEPVDKAQRAAQSTSTLPQRPPTSRTQTMAGTVVVPAPQGLRLHPAGWRRQGCVRPHQCRRAPDSTASTKARRSLRRSRRRGKQAAVNLKV